MKNSEAAASSSRIVQARHNTLSIALLTVLTASLPAQAKDASTQSDVTTKDLDTVMVRSTHREKPLQKTPISVGVVTAEQLDRTNLSNISDLQHLTPGLSYSGTAIAANGGGFQIRGIGTQAFSVAAEQTVGTVVDDVVLNISRDPGVSGFNDIAQIEVLRGPQGTLFGKNASAGVVNISTHNPEIGSTESSLQLSLGERNEHVVRFTNNLGISDTSAARVSVYYNDQHGAVPNVFHKWNAGDRTGTGIRGKFLWSPNKNLDILLSAERQTLFARDPYLMYTLNSDPEYVALFDGFDNVGGDNFKSYADADWSSFQGVTGFSGKIDYRLGNGATLTSITAYRSSYLVQKADVDQTPANFLNGSETLVRAHQTSQEFRLTGATADEKLDYVFGAYYVNVDSTNDYMAYGGFSYRREDPQFYLSITGPKQHMTADTKSHALYANTTYQLSNRWAASMGLRYTSDRVTAAMTPINIPTINGKPVLPFTQTVSSSNGIDKGNVSGKLALQFQQSPTLMWYVNASTGYKGPTIDVTSTRSNRIQPEKSATYELGIKSQALEQTLTFNAAVFWSEFKDFQAQTYDPESRLFRLSNAGKMRTRGIELESSWRPTPNFSVDSSAAFIDAKFLDYIGICPTPGDAQCLSVDGAMIGDLSGFSPAFVPRYTYSLGGTYYHSFGNGLVVDTNLGWSYKSEYYNEVAQSQSKSDGYGIARLSAGIGTEDGRWRVSLYARNLLNEHYRAYIIQQGQGEIGGTLQYLPSEAFRTVGISLNLKF